MNKQRTILVVDDEPHITHVLTLKLRKAGFDVVSARDGEEGFELARQHEPDLIITDLWMPYMTGTELCARLSKTPELADTPVIVLTARGYALDEKDESLRNVFGVLSKPFSPREVLTLVGEVLDGQDGAGGEAAAA